MLRSVPTGISCFRGTMAVSTIAPERRTNLTWLPFWVVSTKPADSSRRLTSRKDWGLSRANLDLDHPDFRRPRRLRRFEVKFQRLPQVGEGLFFGFALAGDVNFEALRDVPVSFAPNRCGKWSFHDCILAQDSEPSDPILRLKVRPRVRLLEGFFCFLQHCASARLIKSQDLRAPLRSPSCPSGCRVCPSEPSVCHPGCEHWRLPTPAGSASIARFQTRPHSG